MTTTKTPTQAETWLLLAGLVFDNRGPWRTQVSEQTGMPFSRFRALRRLNQRPLSGTELADQLEIDAAATSVIVTDLCKRGLVTKELDPNDGRRKIISITEAGRAAVKDVQSMAAPAPVLSALDDAELATLHAILTKLQEASR